MQARRAAREPRRVRVVSPKVRRRRPLSNAQQKDTLHRHSFTHLLDYKEEGDDDDLFALQRNTLSGADPSLNILSIDAALNRAVLGSDTLCADLCTTTTMRHDIPALSSSRHNKSRLPATRRLTHNGAQDVLTGDDEGGIHTIAAAEQGKQCIITVPLSPVPQKAAATTNVGQIVSSILDPLYKEIDEGKSDEATLVDDEADIAAGLDALRERLAQARERLESHIGHYHDFNNSPQVTRVGDKTTKTGHTSNTKKSKIAMRHSVSSTSSSNSYTNTAHVSGAVLSDLLSSSPAGTDTSSTTTTTSEYMGHCDGIAEDNEEWLAGLDDAAWLPAMQTQREQRRHRHYYSAMSFHPTEYAMRLLREASVSCSIKSNVEYEVAPDLLLPQQDKEEEQAEEGTEKQTSSAKLLHELSRQYAHELHKQLTHDPALRRYLANASKGQCAGNNYFAMSASDELQELLLYSLSNRSAPTATKVSQKEADVKAESNDASKGAEQKEKGVEADKSETVLRAQEMLVNKLLQSLPSIPPDLQDELGRQRRLLERLLQVQQREEQRRKYEAQEEVRRRVQAPRLDPATALFTEALHSPGNARLGLTKVVEPFTMAQQLQRIAADMTRPLPPLLTLTTASPLTSAPIQTNNTNNNSNNVREDKTQAALSRQLHEMQTSYQSLLAAEQAKRHAERQAFTELLQKQQAQLLQQHRNAIDALRTELRQTKKGQEEQLARLAASKDAAMERRSAVVQAAQAQTMKHMLQGAVEVMKSYTTGAPAKHSEHRNTKGKGETMASKEKDAVSPAPVKTKPRIDAHFRGPVTVQLPEVRQVSTSHSLHGKSHTARASQLRKLYGSGRSPGTTLRRSTKAQAGNTKNTVSKTQQQQGLQTEESHSESRSRFIAQETRSLSDETSTHSDNSARTELADVTEEEKRAVGSVTQRPHASRRPSSLSTHYTEKGEKGATSVKKKVLRSSLTAGRPAVGRTLLLLTPSAPQPSRTAALSHEDNTQTHEQTTSGVCFGESEATMNCTYGKLWSEYSTALREVQGLQRQLQAEQAASVVHTSGQVHTSNESDRQRHLLRLQHTEEALLRDLRLPKYEERESEERHVHDSPTTEPLLRSAPELLTVSSAVAATARSLCAARQRLRRIASVLFRDEDVEGDAVHGSESLQRYVKEGLVNETIHAVIGEAAEQALLSQLQDKLAEELLQHELHAHIQNIPAPSNDRHTSAVRQTEGEQNWAETLEAAQTQAAMRINDVELTTAIESGLQELIAQALHTTQPQKQQGKEAQAEPDVEHRRSSTILSVPTLMVPSSVPREADVLSESEHEVVHVPPDPNAAWLLGDKPHETAQVQRHSVPHEGKKEQSVVIEPVVHNADIAGSGLVRTHTMDGAVHILIDVGTLTRNATNTNSNAWQPLLSPGTQALPPMQSEQPRRRTSDETLHDVIVESVEPRKTTIGEQGAGLVVPVLPPTIATTQISDHANSAVEALQAQRVREMWQRVHDAVVQDEAQQRWLLCEEEMLQRHTLSALLTRWRTTLATHNLKETTPLLPREPQVNESTPQHDTSNNTEGQGEAEQESTLPPAPPAAAERYIRDPVTRFVFEWLHEFGAREAAQRSRSAAEQSRYFVDQLHYGDELTTTPAQDTRPITHQHDNNATASPAVNNEQANVVSPSPIQSASPFTTTSSSPSASTYSATHASSLTSHGGHVFASRGNEDLMRRARRYPVSSPSPIPAVSSAYIAERSHRHRPLLRVNNNSREESEPTTSTSSESYPVVGVPRRVNGAVAGIDESVTTRYTTLTTATTSTSNSDGVVERPSLVPPSSVTARTANSASMTTETTITTTSSSSASMPRQPGEGVVRHAPSYTTSASLSNDNNTTRTTRATTTTTTTTTQTSETSLVDSSSAAAAAARRRRLISPLNAEDIEAETDNEGEGSEGRGQQAIESNAPRPGWW